ncbi:MAG: response regulator [Gammaproteobacteria bacterium]|nr:response regulator [Gammaproteobacteria bacterium]
MFDDEHDGKLINVILADDDSSTRFLLQSLLNKNGCKVLAAKGDGEALLDAYRHLKAIYTLPDMILLDISMPGALNGVDVLKKLREANPDLYVVMISGETDGNVVREVIAAGAAGFIVKPFTVGRIRELIASFRKKAGL